MRIGLLLSVLIAAVAGLCLVYPAAAATACPPCYGFADLGDRIFVEPGLSPEQRLATKATIEAARDRVRDFYGSLSGDPRILLCATQACYGRFGGGSRGMALLDRALFLSPRGADIVIAAHELSHIELHSRLGLMKTLSKAIPQWFDEGAVVVSDDPRYLTASSRGDRCRVEPDGDMPSARTAWIETAQSADLYAKAACRVNRWIVSHGGPAAVAWLADAVAAGESFPAAAR